MVCWTSEDSPGHTHWVIMDTRTCLASKKRFFPEADVITRIRATPVSLSVRWAKRCECFCMGRAGGGTQALLWVSEIYQLWRLRGSKMRVPTWFHSRVRWTLLLVHLLHPPLAERGRERDLKFQVSLWKGIDHIMRALLLWPNSLLKTPSPKPIALGIRVSTDGCGGT